LYNLHIINPTVSARSSGSAVPSVCITCTLSTPLFLPTVLAVSPVFVSLAHYQPYCLCLQFWQCPQCLYHLHIINPTVSANSSGSVPSVCITCTLSTPLSLPAVLAVSPQCLYHLHIINPNVSACSSGSVPSVCITCTLSTLLSLPAVLALLSPVFV